LHSPVWVGYALDVMLKMKRFTLASIFTISFLVISCAHNPDPIPYIPDYNPGDAVREDIQNLAKIGRLKVWIAGCYNHSHIKTIKDFDDALRYFGELDQKEISLLKDQFKKPFASMYHFGFECDNSVIASFDRHGSQLFIFPEQ